jgi:hypothetical protein
MQSMVPGMAVLLMMFYGVLHTWLNMWAEFLRYGRVCLCFSLIAASGCHLPTTPHIASKVPVVSYVVLSLGVRSMHVRRSFGDRRFYEDWWNARSFASYYRKWNMVVHEWLFYYMYQDAIRCDCLAITPQPTWFSWGPPFALHHLLTVSIVVW